MFSAPRLPPLEAVGNLLMFFLPNAVAGGANDDSLEARLSRVEAAHHAAAQEAGNHKEFQRYKEEAKASQDLMNRTISRLEERIAELEGSNREVKSQVCDLKIAMERSAQRETDAAARGVQLQATLADAQSRIRELETRATTAETARDGLNLRVSELQQKFTSQAQQLTDSRQQITTLAERLDGLSSTLARMAEERRASDVTLRSILDKVIAGTNTLTRASDALEKVSIAVDAS